MTELILFTKHSENEDLTRILLGLTKKGVHWRIVSSFIGALDEIDRERPDAILFHFEASTTTDFIKIKESVKNNIFPIPIIGFGNPWKKLEPHGADYYLEFPFTIEELSIVLNNKTCAKV